MMSFRPIYPFMRMFPRMFMTPVMPCMYYAPRYQMPIFMMPETRSYEPIYEVPEENNSSVDLFRKTYESIINKPSRESVWKDEDVTPSADIEHEDDNDEQAEQTVDISSIPDEKKLGAEFLERVKLVAQNLKCDYKDLLAVLNSESSLNPQAGLDRKTGKIKGAVGLLQFTNIAIEELNRRYNLDLTKEKILKMTAVEQLDLVEKYLKIAKSRVFGENERLSAANLYAITFLPARANRLTLCTKGEKDSEGRLLRYYEKNQGLDLNNDGKITKGELAQRINNKRVNESIFA